MASSRLPHPDALDAARKWATDIFGSQEEVLFVVVEYEPPNPKGRRNKKSVLNARESILAACRGGAVSAALEAITSLQHLDDPGISVCINNEDLASVLSERLRRGECCYVDNRFPAGGVHLVVWRE